MNTVLVATRSGRLATVQAELAARALKKANPDYNFKLQYVTTEGDSDRKTALWQLETTGFFTSAIEQKLQAGSVDIAVHSLKDLPVTGPDDLTIAAVCFRDHVEDCLIAAGNITSIDELKPAARIGTSSMRRAVQIKRLRADLDICSIRGNITTRIDLMEKGSFDAVMLARAGLERIGLADKISVCFNEEVFLPAPGQGALALQIRKADADIFDVVSKINDRDVQLTTSAERQILKTTQCGCHGPVGAIARIKKGSMIINAFVSDLNAERFIRDEIKGPAEKAVELAKELAEKLLSAGGARILKELER